MHSATAKGQEDIEIWGNSLIATGGTLNGDKCSYTVSDQIPDGKGGWSYYDKVKKKETDDDELDELEAYEDISISISQVSGNVILIKRLRTDEAVENLGLFTRPD